MASDKLNSKQVKVLFFLLFHLIVPWLTFFAAAAVLLQKSSESFWGVCQEGKSSSKSWVNDDDILVGHNKIKKDV